MAGKKFYQFSEGKKNMYRQCSSSEKKSSAFTYLQGIIHAPPFDFSWWFFLFEKKKKKHIMKKVEKKERKISLDASLSIN